MIVVDTCVLVDVIDADPQWAGWSREQLDTWSARGPLIINAVVYAELSVRFDTIDATDGLVERAGLDLREIPRGALFLAGKASQLYRRRGGTRTGVLSDFFIGAHAAVLRVPVLTRDVARYARTFSRSEAGRTCSLTAQCRRQCSQDIQRSRSSSNARAQRKIRERNHLPCSTGSRRRLCSSRAR